MSEKSNNELKTYTFDTYNTLSSVALCGALEEIIKNNKEYTVICVGSDLIVGDSLGPLVGTMLKNNNFEHYLYGTLSNPITAKEIKTIKENINKVHPNKEIIVIDASVGAQKDIGLIRITNKGIRPGLGVNKYLDEIGDISITGIVSEKSENNISLYNLTRLNLIYKMADVISNALIAFSKTCAIKKRICL